MVFVSFRRLAPLLRACSCFVGLRLSLCGCVLWWLGARLPVFIHCVVVVCVAWSCGVSARSRRLPPDWSSRRRAVLLRDGGVCQWRVESGVICGAPASDVDHIVPNDDDSLGNLRALCSEHHRRKTGGEGAAAARRRLLEVRSRFRRVEPHPGLVGGVVGGG